MPRHSFKFHKEVRIAVKKHVNEAISSLDPKRFNQEAPYLSALAAKMEGIVYEGEYGFVKFNSTIVDDRGKGSAESWSGADLVITAEISDNKQSIRKAILVQAKRGRFEELSVANKAELVDQINKMRKYTASPKVITLEDKASGRIPKVLSGKSIASGKLPMEYDLDDYMTQRVLTTFDGDTRPDFVNSVQDSALSKLTITAVTVLK